MALVNSVAEALSLDEVTRAVCLNLDEPLYVVTRGDVWSMWLAAAAALGVEPDAASLDGFEGACAEVAEALEASAGDLAHAPSAAELAVSAVSSRALELAGGPERA